MPLTISPAIQALRGLSATRAPILLIQIDWPSPAGSRFYSSSQSVTWSGHVWEANRAMSVPSFQSGLIDRKNKNFDRLEIEFDNLADNGSSSFPFTGLEAGQNLEDAKVSVFAYSPDALDAVQLWSGYTQGRGFGGKDKVFKLSADFFWNSFDISIPQVPIQQRGFSLNASSGKTNDDDDEQQYIPIVYGLANAIIRPLIYNHWVEGSVLKVECALSGVHAGLPFSAGDITAANVKLGPTAASVVEFYPGNQVAAPSNLTRFPENQIHPLVAFFYAEFAINDENKATVDNLPLHAIKAKIGNGRPLLDTGLPSENPVLILRDILRDPVFGLGLPFAAFDNTKIAAAASYVSTRYSVIYNFHEQVSLTALVQSILGDCHCYIDFENGLIGINAKKNTETAAGTFATIDSGVGGRKIEDDYTDASIKDSSELLNQITRTYRVRAHPRRILTLYDPTAQAHAGGTIKKVVADDIDSAVNGGIFDETQMATNTAIMLREDLNANLYEEFSSPFWDSLDVAAGDVWAVRGVDKFNNAVNKDIRITKKTIDADAGTISFSGQIYKQAIYNDNATALGVDLLRGGVDSVAVGRPPDVVPVSLTLVDVVTNDTEGRLAQFHATFTVPAFDPSLEQADGQFREAPISEVEIWWHFTDTAITTAQRGGILTVRQGLVAFNASIDFQTDFRKSKTVEAFFVAIAPNRSRSKLGYIPDPLKTTSLTGSVPIGSSVVSYSVVSATGFAVNDYIICEKEINRIQAIVGNRLDCFHDGVQRIAFFDTLRAAHADRTEIAVAKQSYPSLTRALNSPRFTYPVVTGLTATSQGERVDFKWADISAENRENYLLYWSTSPTALTDPNLLGSANPTWYATNPLAPPAGVNLSINDDLQHKVLQADVGGPNVMVRARVAARNGKNNYSISLSAAASNSSSGSNAPDTGPPNNGTAITIKKAKLKSGGKLIVRPLIPVLQMNSWFKNVLVIHDNNATGAGRRFYDPAESAWVATYADGTTEIDIGLGTVEGMPLKKSEVFVGGRTQFYVRFGVWNQFNGGTATYSSDLGNPITQGAAEGDGLETDPAAPTLASPSFPDLQESFGIFQLSAPTPTANTVTLDEFQFVMSTQSTAPAGSPTVGSEGVVKIKKGQFVEFRRRTDVAVTLYFYYRAHNAFGYSVWSAGSNVLNTGISRPGEDIIGTDVPRLPFGLQRGANGAASPANTGNTYYLDAGASAEPNIYVGMTLHIPAFIATNKLRQITAYDSVLKKVTVSPAWTSVPGNNVAFEIHRGTVNNSRANQSGNGHTTAVFILDSGASAVDGFYNGWFLWIPGAVAADTTRQVTSYIGATRACTVDVAFTVAPANLIAYFITQGNIGYTSSAASVVSAAAPIRAWLDTQGAFNQVEVISTQGDNAYSLTHFQIQVATGAGQVKHDKVLEMTSAPSYSFSAVSAGRAVRVRFRNLYRGNVAVPSDGWSSWSDWAAVPRDQISPPVVYTPSLYIPIDVDSQDRLPGGHYQAY